MFIHEAKGEQGEEGQAPSDLGDVASYAFEFISRDKVGEFVSTFSVTLKKKIVEVIVASLPSVEHGPTLQPTPTTSEAMLIDPRPSLFPLLGLIYRGKDDPH
ncbi:hypothetical protein VNO80_26923 [Phaseolus coccineus]|uniref:Uncharacterized protein n=1 Tax=Phaseolus coccineus TaxID=3886 RepID=A0AAN9QH51_PHACN